MRSENGINGASIRPMNERTDCYKGFPISLLREAFTCSHGPDWKAPIAVLVPGEAVALTVAAIEFFTATTATVKMSATPVSGIKYLVESVGYRNGPAGDH